MIIQFTKTVPTQSRVLKKDEHITLVTCLTKGWRDKKVFTVQLDGEGSSFSWFIFVFGSGNEKFHFDVHVNHKGKYTKSRVYARSVLQENALVQFNGTSRIEEGAHKADTYLSFHTLLLSPEAHAQTVPSLEILTQDVVAGHAASVDRFLPNDLFYLTTRGLSGDEAKKLLVTGFMLADCTKISDKKFVSKITRRIEDRIAVSSILTPQP